MSIDISRRKTPQKRELQTKLLAQMARTGRLLERFRRERPQCYQAILRDRGISSSEADDYIAVFHNIEMIKIAEQWHYDHSGGILMSPKEALNLLTKWQNHRH